MTPVALARARFVRMSPRKLRYVLDLIRRKPVPEACSILDRAERRASLVVRKLVMQAADSALKLKQMPAEALVVSRIFADGAGMVKRFRSMSMGRAGMIRKRLSHITVELGRIGAAIPAGPERAAAKTAPKIKETRSRTGFGRGAAAKRPFKKLAGAK